ncbi:expressed unknown protein [Seminavis robusta]|uniref:L domain-like protein n=1 Tax=Seminavis robusta TaxID=568900 RepID=A0A9N8DIR1_9STRA|nr:expressed unknown protein [Seminavis robusta]|eukprot:Sro107_g053920.1 n/a (421) ;mRNA; f:71565-72827
MVNTDTSQEQECPNVWEDAYEDWYALDGDDDEQVGSSQIPNSSSATKRTRDAEAADPTAHSVSSFTEEPCFWCDDFDDGDATTKTKSTRATSSTTASSRLPYPRRIPQKHFLREKHLQRSCSHSFLWAVQGFLLFNLILGLLFNPQKGHAPPVHYFIRWPLETPPPLPVVTPAPGNNTGYPLRPLTTDDLGPLPGYTLEALKDEFKSPQSLAFHWLQADHNWNTYSVGRLRQRFALAVLYFSTNPPFQHTWTRTGDWLSYETHECEWMMFMVDSGKNHLKPMNLCTVDSDDDRHVDDNGRTNATSINYEAVRRLHLSNNNLVGHLPPEVDLLSSLTDLRVNDNRLSGQVPDEWGFTQELPDGGGFQPPLWFRLHTLHLQNNDGLLGDLPSNRCSIDDLKYDCAKDDDRTGGGLCGCGCRC